MNIDLIKNRAIDFVKRNRLVYVVYRDVWSAVINMMKLFIKTDDRLILFVSFGGRYFNESPRAMYEYMAKDERFSGYRMIWAFREPEKFPVDDKVRIDSIRYYLTALKAVCWITNVSIERGLRFSGKNTFYFFTTHGTLPKLTGHDVRKGSVFAWDFRCRYDCSCAQSVVEQKYQESMYGLRPDQILVCGYPKNDRLAHVSEDNRKEALKRIGLPENKKIILYAPTFRDSGRARNVVPVSIDKWKTKLGDDYVFLLRTHPAVSDKISIRDTGDFFYDVSNYDDNIDLMIVSDYLISDYSGIFFEYAILHRPMYCYAYDYDEYQTDRGLYFDIREELPSGDEDYIIERIKSSSKEDMEQTERFISKYVTEYGNATRIAVNRVYQEMKQREY